MAVVIGLKLRGVDQTTFDERKELEWMCEEL